MELFDENNNSGFMKEFEELLNIADRLLGPGGCSWDQEQTLLTLQPYLLEEAHELIEAIDQLSDEKMKEELGDVLYALIFIGRLGEKEGKFTLKEAIRSVSEKLIRRHPHVFGEEKVNSNDDIIKNWEEIKKKEGKKNPIDGIPPTLPSLARAQKVIHKLRRAKSPLVLGKSGSRDLGERLWELVKEADEQGIDAESLLRRVCQGYEEKFLKSFVS